MVDENDEAADLVESIFARTEYAPARPASRQFRPWHRPRKQFVRREQWVAQILRILESRTDVQPLRYVGLPGTDLLDVRYFHRAICVPQGRGLLFLGFNSGAQLVGPEQTDLYTSLAEVWKLHGVDEQSNVVGDDFRTLGNNQSMAWKTARDLGPFDVVNLDLCDGLTTEEPGDSQSIYLALQRLLALQSRQHRQWVLLLTTRVGRDQFAEATLQLLIGKLKSNIDGCEPFRVAVEKCFGIGAANVDPAQWTDEIFFYLLITCICKWIWGLGQQPPCHMELASAIGYHVNPASECMDMISLALRFEPSLAPATDPIGLGTATSEGVDECAEVAKFPGRIAKTIDADGVVHENVEVRNGLITETEMLLEIARYDVSGYRHWLGAD